ncbi:MAG: carboxypeptidase regulatory-like domain-containing protein, partial [Acidobacteria bacterium]|nr:carboxypeptidase regulatory-like domain-containing protein [Acidobacteriota bacterium]
MKSLVRVFFSVLMLSLLLQPDVWAQGSTAQISGMVRDQSGAVLPGVEISVTQTNTGLVRNVISNETGFYVVPNLPTGPYRLEAALSGFRTFVQTGIVL